MSQPRRSSPPSPSEQSRKTDEGTDPHNLPRPYRRACRRAAQGRYELARRLYATLEKTTTDPRLRTLIGNDLAVLTALVGDTDAACRVLQTLSFPEGLDTPTLLNLALLQADRVVDAASVGHQASAVPVPHTGAVKVALLSFLFNWPSTGGGIIHTLELGQFLARAGYEVRHFYARYPLWGIGQVREPLPTSAEALEFDESTWNVPTIQARFRAAVDVFGPDCALITDAWNMKPLLAEAVRGYPYFLRFQALECLCPLNNLRLLADGPDRVEQCPRHQLATPDVCRRCLGERGHTSGRLHQLERALAGVGTPEYDRALRRALDEAEAVLVLNPLTEALLGPYARRVAVVPWGMDPDRFPWPPPEEPPGASPDGVVTCFMAAVGGEFIKGYHVLHEACRRLRRTRTDFALVVTTDPAGPIDEFTRSVGWVSQEELPRHYRAADVCVVPTIAQEGLSRTSVEAMASGRPVVASRIGGLPFTVSDGGTGLLCAPGDPDDLARALARLLDDPPLRRRMGLAGRRRFEQDFTWDGVIERHYRPLLEQVAARGSAGASRQPLAR